MSELSVKDKSIALADAFMNLLDLLNVYREAYADSKERIAELENDEVHQRLANAEHQLYMAELAKYNLRASRKAQFRKRLVAEKRIAELESRRVRVEELRSFVTDADILALRRFCECCDDPESGGHDLEKEQVARLEKIGALQRSGRISYITDFGDYLISITAGIECEVV
jgi:hypothetical protein